MKRPFVAMLAAVLVLGTIGSSAALARDGGFPHTQHDRGRDDRSGGRGWNDNHRWERGHKAPPSYRAPQHAISHPGRYHLRPAPRGHQWVRAGSDALLVISRSGVIVDVKRGLFR